MSVLETISGSGMDRIPNIAFRGMSFLFAIWEIFASPEKLLKKFNIKEGDTVVDYGCGPGSYIKAASILAGNSGTVYAADVHELAIAAVNKKIERYGLTNVKTAQVTGYKSTVPDNCADIVYALDMFHMVKKPDLFLKEINRILKKNGRLYIEDGHQPRKRSKNKIESSKMFKIAEEHRGFLVCSPV
ncbi:MAG: class I SAM-dependent methyltransferase [Spirochaetes bacterium]|nr:class I SAM-dependent methyltransferase [Spirochaetota bacterium]MBN2772202.1 class I SAM-dependent methyltransferase [Spirochaetota bacterium]